MIDRIYRWFGWKSVKIPSYIAHDIVKSLEIIGEEQWPGSYEVVKLSDTVWCVQPLEFSTPPIGRYEVEVNLVNSYPIHFTIRHAGWSNISVIANFASTDTTTTKFQELIVTLRKVHKNYGPMIMPPPRM
jgi:hypothetical protein